VRAAEPTALAGDRFDPVDVLPYAIEELGHSQAELADILDSRSRASEALARRRPPDPRDDPKDQCKLGNPGPMSSCSPIDSRNSSLSEVDGSRPGPGSTEKFLLTSERPLTGCPVSARSLPARFPASCSRAPSKAVEGQCR
jgi:hypothetical protein